MTDSDPGNVVKDVRQSYRPEDGDVSDIAWIDAAIDEGLASPPSELSVAEIMTRHRQFLG